MPAINSLTGSVGLKLGPLMVETLLKHYFERPGAEKQASVQLREDELLYDEAFNVVKVRAYSIRSTDPETGQTFLDASTRFIQRPRCGTCDSNAYIDTL
jgi:hypothetical protein